MKILLIDNSAMAYDNRGHYFTNKLNGLFIRDLTRLGHHLSYYQFAVDSEKTISVFDLEENGVQCHPIRNHKNKYLGYLNAYCGIIKHIRQSDFVYFFYPNSFKYATFLCRLLRKKYGLYIRGMHGVDDIVSITIYRHAYTIFTVSDYFTNMVNELTCNHVANTIRPMIPYSEKDIVMDRKYVNKSTYNILYLGRIDRDKGIDELLHAVKELRSYCTTKFNLKIVGNGNYATSARQITKFLGIEDIVEFLGPVYDDDAKREIFINSDIYILPTYHEGFPRTLYEAMIFGTPIITTFVGGIPSLMKDGINCIRIEKGSIQSIVDKLRYAMDNYSDMGHLTSSAASTVRTIVDCKRLSHGEHLNQILSQYEK